MKTMKTFLQLTEDIDIAKLSRSSLKVFTKLAREEYKQPIDLRSASDGAMCDYLRDYFHWKKQDS